VPTANAAAAVVLWACSSRMNNCCSYMYDVSDVCVVAVEQFYRF
jgi:hypothetical protein